MSRVSANVTELFGRLGTSSEEVQAQLGRLDRKPLAALERLGVAFGSAALVANKYARVQTDARIDLPPFGSNPTPRAAAAALEPFVGGSYASSAPAFELHRTRQDPVRALFDPRQQRGAKLVRLVQTNERVRTLVERAMNERIVVDGRTDARLTVLRGGAQAAQRSQGSSGVNTSALTASGGGGGMPTPPSASDFYGLFMAMDQAVMEEAHRIGVGTSSGYSAKSFLDFPPIDYESETTESMRDGGGAASGMFGMGMGMGTGMVGPGNAPEKLSGSTDEAVLRLKRMLDKREQMYNIWRSTFDKYSEAAKASIDAMRA